MSAQNIVSGSELEERLALFCELLDREGDCLLRMQYKELLQIVNEKQILLAKISVVPEQVSRPQAQGRKRLRELLEAVRDKSIDNERLARSSIRIVTDLAGFIAKKSPYGGQYDRRGIAHGFGNVSTLNGSA